MITTERIKEYANSLVDKGGSGWEAFYALCDWIDANTAEDEKELAYCPQCGCGSMQYKDENQIALRKWKEYRKYRKEYYDEIRTAKSGQTYHARYGHLEFEDWLQEDK